MIRIVGEPLPPPQITITEVTDPVEIAHFRKGMAQFKLNSDWLQSHWPDLLPQARGKFVAVAGQEAFLGETGEEAWSKAMAAHPEDEGAFSQYVFPEDCIRIYANQG